MQNGAWSTGCRNTEHGACRTEHGALDVRIRSTEHAAWIVKHGRSGHGTWEH